MEKIITFLIPAYNSEAYLPIIMESLLEASCLQEMETIIVNDGSIDGTEAVARSYAEQYPGTVRVLCKPNGGHGSAINAGAKLASGKYFKVIDADDWIIKENLPLFIEKLKKCDADVVLTPFHQVDIRDGSRSAWKMYCDSYERAYSLEEIVEHWKDFDRCLTFHGITYRTDFYNRYHHKLPEKVFYEDQEFSAIPCCRAASIWPMDLYLYQYRVGDSGQSVSSANRVKRMSHVVRVTRDMLLYQEKHAGLSEAALEFLYRKTESVILSHYVVTCLLVKDRAAGLREAERYNRMMRKISPEVYWRVYRKYKVYVLMNRLHVSEGTYQFLLHSRLYSLLRRSHRIEKE